MKVLAVVSLCVGLVWGASIGSSDNDILMEDELDLDLDNIGYPIISQGLEEDKKPCCLPKVWEGGFGESVEYEQVHHKQTEDDLDRRHHRRPIHGSMSILGGMAVDSNKKKVAAGMTLFQHGHASNMSIIVDYSAKQMYLIDPDKKACRKAKVQGDMAEQCIPKDARYQGTGTFGLGNPNSMKYDAWVAMVKRRTPVPQILGIQMLVTPDQCAPVIESGMGYSNGFKVRFGASFFNLKGSISDPNVFTPPKYCDKAEEIDPEVAQANPLVSSLTNRFSK